MIPRVYVLITPQFEKLFRSVSGALCKSLISICQVSLASFQWNAIFVFLRTVFTIPGAFLNWSVSLCSPAYHYTFLRRLSWVIIFRSVGFLFIWGSLFPAWLPALTSLWSMVHDPGGIQCFTCGNDQTGSPDPHILSWAVSMSPSPAEAVYRVPQGTISLDQHWLRVTVAAR